MNYPTGNAQNYPGMVPNLMPASPVYFPPGSMNQPGNNYPQYPANIPFPNGGAGYGFTNSRNKRQAKLPTTKIKSLNKSTKKYQNEKTGEQNDSEEKVHWGIHRILSTGKGYRQSYQFENNRIIWIIWYL